jgi:glycosyltransferase involved in cell wall biosynthesis
MFRHRPIATVAMNLTPRSGSWGGANQWASQIAKALRLCGYDVRYDLRRPADVILMTHTGLSAGTSFGVDEVRAFKVQNPGVPCVHRINDNDLRKGTDRMDAFLARSSEVADHTVFVSEWLRDYHAERWFDTARPHSIIAPGANPAVFHPLGNRPPTKGGAFRIVTHHWSDHPSKGFPVYARIDEAIASGELPGFELWVIGRWPRDLRWQTARTFPPCAGRELAQKLRACHAYVTASRHEPGAMHPVEGIQCGLPVAFSADSGGSATQCAPYGVRFERDVLAALLELRDRHADLRDAVLSRPPSGDLMCLEYRRLLQSLIASRTVVPAARS